MIIAIILRWCFAVYSVFIFIFSFSLTVLIEVGKAGINCRAHLKYVISGVFLDRNSQTHKTHRPHKAPIFQRI